jgi:peptidyl-Lys metalloendopeptidase
MTLNARRTGLALALLLLLRHGWAAPGGVVVEVTPERQTRLGSDDVTVVVTIRNTATAPRYVPAWQTPFAGVQAPLFDVTRDGLPVRYLGILAKRAAPAAADFITLAPGAARSSRVELSALYRMDVTGAYSVRYRADRLQVYARPDTARPLGSAAVASTAAAVWIDGRMPRGLPETADGAAVPAPAGPGLAFSHCSNAQQDGIAGAVQAGQAMAADATAYMQNNVPAARYTAWFGPPDAARAATVARHMDAIRDAFANRPLTVDCACTKPWFAYVYPDQPYTIHVCKAFWNARPTGTDSKGGTLMHELSHFTVVAGTDDWAYGQDAAGALAGSDPARAVDNADSHEYFGENDPRRALR